MMRQTCLSLLFLFSVCTLFAQDEGLFYVDYTYQPYIKTVQLTPEGLPLNMPIVSLGRGNLLLTFDDLDGDVKNYTYKIEPCNPDWTPNTNLQVMDWLQGFEEDFMRTFTNSFNTFTAYTHWTLRIPGGNMKITRSGNYLLKVYVDDGYGKALAITRRFILAEELSNIQVKQVYPADVKKIQTHQELDFSVGYKTLKIANPLIEVSAVVIQNGRWDNAIMGLTPSGLMPDLIKFDWQNKVVFEAGREWRWVDTRSVRFKLGSVAEIEEEEDSFTFRMKPETDRYNLTYVFDRDINGNFVLGCQDFRDCLADTQADYVNVEMTFVPDEPLEDEDLYVMGAMTEWLPKTEWRMTPNADNSEFTLNAMFKQGFYNYAFVPIAHGNDQPEWDAFEGNWQETNNTYTFIIYYRQFGTPNYRVIGVTSYDSVRF